VYAVHSEMEVADVDGSRRSREEAPIPTRAEKTSRSLLGCNDAARRFCRPGR
jgi:hypothetical protein